MKIKRNLFVPTGNILISKGEKGRDLMCIRPKWSVKYLVGFGAMTINEEEEFYHAWTKFGAWLAFLKHHSFKPPTTYQCNYSFRVMWDDINRV